ncbi:MAG: hypothetical protein GQ535_05670 [Rhodobacteraceae bacterium]|nr:hypothetical protein [Paracoccaceae bacterium]
MIVKRLAFGLLALGVLGACDPEQEAQMMFGVSASKVALVQRANENGPVALLTDSVLAQIIASKCASLSLDSDFYNAVGGVRRRAIFVNRETRTAQGRARSLAFEQRHNVDLEASSNLCAAGDREIQENTVLSGHLVRN